MGLTRGKIQIQMHTVSQQLKKLIGKLKIKIPLDLCVKPICSQFLSHV